jgi:hypothetical protein
MLTLHLLFRQRAFVFVINKKGRPQGRPFSQYQFWIRISF